METCRIVMRRYQYLDRLNSLRAAGCETKLLDEAWYDNDELFARLTIRGVTRRKLSWTPNCLYFPSKSIGDCKADYRNEMNSDVFENWL